MNIHTFTALVLLAACTQTGIGNPTADDRHRFELSDFVTKTYYVPLDLLLKIELNPKRQLEAIKED